jgi:hypothetical protein
MRKQVYPTILFSVGLGIGLVLNDAPAINEIALWLFMSAIFFIHRTVTVRSIKR